MSCIQIVGTLVVVLALSWTPIATAQTAPAASEEVGLVGTWLVTVEGESNTRTLVISDATPSPSGALTAAKYGMSGGNLPPVDAKLLRSGDKRQLNIVTQASSVIAATEQVDGSFKGTFTTKSGAVKSVVIARVPDGSLPRAAERTDPVAPIPLATGTPKECAALHGAIAATTTETRADSVDRPKVAVGDCWMFRTIDLWKNQETRTFLLRVTAVSGDNIEFARTLLTSATETVTGRATRVRFDGSTMSFLDQRIVAGSVVNMKFPLTVGANWKYSYKMSRPNGSITNLEASARVVGWETVKVAAGSFNALKVVQDHNWNRTESSGNFNGVSTHSYWYVPSAKLWVKYEFFDRGESGQLFDRYLNELTQFQVAQ